MVWLVYPALSTARPHWREMRRLVNQFPFVDKNEVAKSLEFSYHKDGGLIEFKSADKPENLRGIGLDYAIFDEAAFIDEDVWIEVVYPMLMDRDGDAMFISTPKGQNWFYKLYQKGQQEIDGFKSWRKPSWVNPNITQDRIAARKLAMPKYKFDQEILADFVGSGGGAFVGADKACVLRPLEEPDDAAVYTAGIDWGRKNDYTVISVFDKETGDQVFLDAFTDIRFEQQATRIEAVLRRWRPVKTFIELNSIGAVLFEQLSDRLVEQSHIKLRGVYMTNLMKRMLVERLATNVQNGRVRFLTDETEVGREQRIQLINYQLKHTRSGLEITYGAPKGQHDDIVVANMLATSTIRPRSKRVRKYAANKFYN
jgi:hypothetical protein